MAKNKIQFQKGLSIPYFLEIYGADAKCYSELIKMRWPSGFECPHCSHKEYCQLKTRKNLFQCKSCQSQVSVTAGTIFHSTKLPLTKWFLAIHLLTQGKNGISQLELARQLGVSANTGAMIYHKLAQVMLERETTKPLRDKVEIDDAYWGGRKKGKRGRGSENKTSFVAAVEKNKEGHPLRIKLNVLGSLKKEEIKKWAKKHIQQGTHVLSDALPCFLGLEEAGLIRESLVVGNSKDPKKTAPFNWVNTILGNLKTALAGTYHKLSRNHLPRHLATFQYRFNRRFSLKDLVLRLTWVSLRTPPMPTRLLKLSESRW
ncbi:MAG: IS1595 family transposase [Alphaproteobacteria bacterium]|nr:IS1595 family transposase [Alphaproteobacteria bacterium]